MLRKRSTSTVRNDARLSLVLFACAVGTLLVCQAVAVGLAGLFFPWIVVVTSLPWVPLPGQIAQTAAVFALVAVACAPLERHRHWQRSSRSISTRRPECDGVTGAIPGHGRRDTLVAAAAITIAVTGAALAMLAAGSARTQPVIVRDALRSQQRGETALALETLAPAVSGSYDPRRFEIYYLASGWALDLHDWRLAARLSIDLMRAAAAGQDPRSLVAGLSQYELAGQRVIPAFLVRTVVMSAPAGHWRTAVRLLIEGTTRGVDSQFETAVAVAGRWLPRSIRTRFLEAATLLEGDISAGVLRA